MTVVNHPWTVIATATTLKGAVKEADCGSRNCGGLKCNIDINGSRQGPGCSGGQNQATSMKIKKLDNNDEEKNQACLAALIIQEQLAGNGNGTETRRGAGMGTEKGKGEVEAEGSSPYTITTLPSLPLTPNSTVIIITIVPVPTPSTTTSPPLHPRQPAQPFRKLRTSRYASGPTTLPRFGRIKRTRSAPADISPTGLSKTVYNAADGTIWVSNQLFQFTLEVMHPQQIACLEKATVAAGGLSNTRKCEFAPLLTPPKRRGR